MIIRLQKPPFSEKACYTQYSDSSKSFFQNWHMPKIIFQAFKFLDEKPQKIFLAFFWIFFKKPKNGQNTPEKGYKKSHPS